MRCLSLVPGATGGADLHPLDGPDACTGNLVAGAAVAELVADDADGLAPSEVQLAIIVSVSASAKKNV